MARCGIRIRYPVTVSHVRGRDGRCANTVIGEAATLNEAKALAKQAGFGLYDVRFEPLGPAYPARFVVTDE